VADVEKRYCMLVKMRKKSKAGGKNAKKSKSELVIFFSINDEKKPE